MSEEVSRAELEALHCWERDDHVAGNPQMTVFRRRLRCRQARWREAHGHPIGTQPIAPKPGGKPGRLVGSRLPLAYAMETGANFLSRGAHEAVRRRTAMVEPHQTLDHQRLWADLLWSPALAFNLFGDLAADLELADRALHTCWPDVPGTVCQIRFAHSPGRFDPAYLGSLRAFDAAFVLDLDDGTRGIVAVDTKFHERAKSEIPRPENLHRYLEVSRRSKAFAPGAVDAVKGRSELCVMWLEHLLLHSMLQHESGTWRWGRYVVIHPDGNSDITGLCARYASLLADGSTYASLTLEQLLDAGALLSGTAAALRERYLIT